MTEWISPDLLFGIDVPPPDYLFLQKCITEHSYCNPLPSLLILSQEGIVPIRPKLVQRNSEEANENITRQATKGMQKSDTFPPPPSLLQLPVIYIQTFFQSPSNIVAPFYSPSNIVAPFYSGLESTHIDLWKASFHMGTKGPKTDNKTHGIFNHE